MTYEDFLLAHADCLVCDDMDDREEAYDEDEYFDGFDSVLDDMYADDLYAVTQRDVKQAKVAGMQMTNRSIKTVILPMIGRRASEPRRRTPRQSIRHNSQED